MPTSLTDVLAQRGITSPTPIQAATLPDSLAGRDVLGRGRTGSGKTYGFLLPVVARLAGEKRPARAGSPRALILAPTRELAAQIADSLEPLAQATGLRQTTIFGGVNQNPQVRALTAGVDVVVACPGRLEDLIGQGHVRLDAIEITVLDEADHMADLGFLPVVRRLLDRTPPRSQRLLFSATLDNAIDSLVKRYLNQPVTHEADSAQSPVAAMEHRVLRVGADQRLPTLVDLISAPGRTVVFTRTKSRAKALTRQLGGAGVAAVELHGNLSQNARTRAMDAFHSGAAQALVATDIAARGIHVDDVGLVIHADPPVEHKAYLHRSGRTARAGQAGTVVTLMTEDQAGDVRTLLRKAGIKATPEPVNATVLAEIAPGERNLPGALTFSVPQQPAGRNRSGAGGSRSGNGSVARGRDNAGRDGSGRDGSGRGGSGRGGSGRTDSGRGGAGRSARPAAARTDSGGSARSGRSAGSSGQSAIYSTATGSAPTGSAVRSGGSGAGGRSSSGARRSGGAPGAGANAQRRSGGAAAFSARSSAGRRG